MEANTPAALQRATASVYVPAGSTSQMDVQQLFEAIKTLIAMRHMLSMQRTAWAVHLLDEFVDAELSSLVSEADRRIPAADDEDFAAYRDIKAAAHPFMPITYRCELPVDWGNRYA